MIEEIVEEVTLTDYMKCEFQQTVSTKTVLAADFFQLHDYFGASEDQISIFEQRTIPAFDSQVSFIKQFFFRRR